MTLNPRIARNRRIRADIDGIVTACKSGTILFTDEISKSLSSNYRSVTNRNVGNIIREREDVKLIAYKTWQKV